MTVIYYNFYEKHKVVKKVVIEENLLAHIEILKTKEVSENDRDTVFKFMCPLDFSIDWDFVLPRFQITLF